MKLHIANNLSLPADAATQTFAFIGRKGSGKTYAAGKLTECLIDAGVQVVILDSVGNWYGLRLSADGKSSGYDIPVLGGLRGDIPLEAAGGHLIADILTETGRSLILDISQFSKADRQRFALAFAERLWRNKKAEQHPTPIHLVIEESQLIVPEKVRGDAAPMVGIYEEIIRLGRNYGIGVSMISQRPQSVNKEVLNQTECLFAFQVNGKHERIALRDWIVYHGAEKSLVDELPSLSIGTAYVWSPQWLQILDKVKIGPKKTLDASATPKVGGARVRRDLKPLDLDDLKAQMASTIEKAKADDPKALRARIAELEREIAKKMPATVERVEVPAVKPEDWQRLQKATDAVLAAVEAVQELAEKMHGEALNVEGAFKRAIVGLAPRQVDKSHAAPTPPKPQKVAAPSASSNGHLPKGELAVLTVAAQYPDGATREQITILTGYKKSSRDTYIYRLKESGHIEQRDDLIFATDTGFTMLGPNFEPLPTGPALQEYWRGRLAKGEREILDVLLAANGEVVSRQSVSDATKFKKSSRDTYLYRLKARKLVIDLGDGEVKASDVFFE